MLNSRWRHLVLSLLATGAAFAQSEAPAPLPPASIQTVSGDTQVQPGTPAPQQPDSSSAAKQADAQQAATAAKRQPKRILGIMPNYRAVSAGTIPPPPTPAEAFKIATQNSFDYSSFIFVGITSLMAEATDAHPQLREGMAGFGRYYWRGFLDKTDGNYLVIFALPTFLHEDERYYAKGEGGIWKRAVYSASRVLITPDYHGHNTFNAAEIAGRGMAQAISISYYPSHDRTIGDLAGICLYGCFSKPQAVVLDRGAPAVSEDSARISDEVRQRRGLPGVFG